VTDAWPSSQLSFQSDQSGLEHRPTQGTEIYVVLLSTTVQHWSVTVTYINGLENDATTTRVLVLHHLLGMFTFLLRTLLEELMESLQGNIVAIEVPCLFNRNITQHIL